MESRVFVCVKKVLFKSKSLTLLWNKKNVLTMILVLFMTGRYLYYKISYLSNKKEHCVKLQNRIDCVSYIGWAVTLGSSFLTFY